MARSNKISCSYLSTGKISSIKSITDMFETFRICSCACRPSPSWLSFLEQNIFCPMIFNSSIWIEENLVEMFTKKSEIRAKNHLVGWDSVNHRILPRFCRCAVQTWSELGLDPWPIPRGKNAVRQCFFWRQADETSKVMTFIWQIWCFHEFDVEFPWSQWSLKWFLKNCALLRVKKSKWNYQCPL